MRIHVLSRLSSHQPHKYTDNPFESFYPLCGHGGCGGDALTLETPFPKGEVNVFSQTE